MAPAAPLGGARCASGPARPASQDGREHRKADVAPAHDGDDLTGCGDLPGQHRRSRGRSRSLRDDAVRPREIPDGVPDLILGDRDERLDVVRDKADGDRPGLDVTGHAVGEGFADGDAHPMAGVHRGGHRRRRRRLHPDHAHTAGAGRPQPEPGRQPASPDAAYDGHLATDLAGKLAADRRLPGDDERVVVRRQVIPAARRHLHRAGLRLVHRPAGAHHGGREPAERRDLGRRRVLRQDDCHRAPQELRGERDAKRVVARRGRDDRDLRAERRERVQAAAHLERPGRLQRLELQHQPRPGGHVHRGRRERGPDHPPGRFDVPGRRPPHLPHHAASPSAGGRARRRFRPFMVSFVTSVNSERAS